VVALAVIHALTLVLQHASAGIVQALFWLLGVHAVREGFLFHLPTLTIRIAEECGGIRSCAAFLVMVALGTWSLRGWKRRLAFVIVGLVVMLLKNGIRIVTLTLLAVHVNQGFLFGKLHGGGGFVFFVMGLGMLVPVWLKLSRGGYGQSLLHDER
jgi:exosortase